MKALTGISDIIRLYKNIAAVLNTMEVLSVPLSVMGGANWLSGSGSVNGLNGLNGANGVGGLNGKSGLVGARGRSGADGLSSFNVLNGLSAWGGLNGKSGLSGLSGLGGLIGFGSSVVTNVLSGLARVNGLNGLNGVHSLNGLNGLNSNVGSVGTGGLSGLNGANGLNGLFGSVWGSGQREYNGFGFLGSVGGYGIDVLPIDNLTEMRSGGLSALMNTSSETINNARMEQLHRITSSAQSIGGGSEIRVDMSGMRNIVNSRSDMDELISRLSSQIGEVVSSMAEGVHY